MVAAQLHVLATCFMCGVIWCVQRTTYPLFVHVNEQSFAAYHAQYTKRITPVVGVPMLVEAVTAPALFWIPGIPRGAAITGIALLAVAWGTTAFVHVPMHERLQKTPDKALMTRLVTLNWIRTIAWTGRAMLCVVFL